MEPQAARERLAAADHDDLFAHWDARPAGARRQLEASLRLLDDDAFALIARLQAVTQEGEDAAGTGGSGGTLTAAPVLMPVDAELGRLREQGEEVLRGGVCGCLTVASGQGTRLGIGGPKGVFPVSPVRNASLFQVFAEKLRAAERRYGTTVPWFVMTSPLNHAETEAFFQDNEFFGLREGAVTFFPQGMHPVFDQQGRLMMAADGGLMQAPDGHGGVLRALRIAAADQLASAGVRYLFYGQVDNPLLTFPDPVFVAAHQAAGSQLSTKVVARKSAGEKMGVPCLRDGAPEIVEYSDIDSEVAAARDGEGNLLLAFGSIAAHVMDVPALFDWGSRLPLHVARKEAEVLVPTAAGATVERTTVIKYEHFVFDAIQRARSPLFVACERAEEFAPLKNETGDDSIATCRQGQSDKYRGWCEQAGIPVARVDADGQPVLVEVSPLFADSVAELKTRLQNTVTRIDETSLFA